MSFKQRFNWNPNRITGRDWPSHIRGKTKLGRHNSVGYQGLTPHHTVRTKRYIPTIPDRNTERIHQRQQGYQNSTEVILHKMKPVSTRELMDKTEAAVEPVMPPVFSCMAHINKPASQDQTSDPTYPTGNRPCQTAIGTATVMISRYL